MSGGPRVVLPVFRARDFFAEAQAAEERLLLPVAADSCVPIKQATGFPMLIRLLKTPPQVGAAGDGHEPQVGAPPASRGIMAQVHRKLSDRPPPQVGGEENGLGSLIDGVIAQEESRLYAPRPSQFEPRLLTPVSAPVVFNHAHGFLTGLKKRRGTAAADAERHLQIQARHVALRLEPFGTTDLQEADPTLHRCRRRRLFEPDFEDSVRMAPVDNAAMTTSRSSMGFIHTVLSANVPAPRRMHTLELEEPMPPAGLTAAAKTAGSDSVGSMAAVLRACSMRPLARNAKPCAEAALQPLGTAQQRAVEFERLLTETIAPLVQCPQQDACWMPSALVGPEPRVLHLEARIMRREPTRRPSEIDPLVQFVRPLAPMQETKSPQSADGVTGYGRARLDAWVMHSANQLMAGGHSRGVCRLPVPTLDGKRPGVSDPLAFLLDGSLVSGCNHNTNHNRAELSFSAAGLLAFTRSARPPQPKLMPELRAPRRQLPAWLLGRYAEHAADTAENDAAYQLNLHYQEDVAMPSSLVGGEGSDDSGLSRHPNEDAMPSPTTPNACGSSPSTALPMFMERMATEDGLQTPTCKPAALEVGNASDATQSHGMGLDESLADAVDSFFVGGDGGDSKRADYGRGGSADEAEAVGLGDLLNKHALASSSLLALLPESAEEHVPLLAAQLVSRFVAAGSTSTILWLLPDALVPAAVSFWHALLAADARCVHSYAARELTCVPATSDEPSFQQTGDSQQAFEPAFEPPLRSGEV